jgi:hypothetical protein
MSFDKDLKAKYVAKQIVFMVRIAFFIKSSGNEEKTPLSMGESWTGQVDR